MTLSPLPVDVTSTAMTNFADHPDGPTAESAREQFEGVFISLLLKEMRKTVGEGVFGGDASDTIGGLFDLTLGQELGKHGGLGITESLARYQRTTEAVSPTSNLSGGRP